MEAVAAFLRDTGSLPASGPQFIEALAHNRLAARQTEHRFLVTGLPSGARHDTGSTSSPTGTSRIFPFLIGANTKILPRRHLICHSNRTVTGVPRLPRQAIA
jgi:hypothetical protein